MPKSPGVSSRVVSRLSRSNAKMLPLATYTTRPRPSATAWLGSPETGYGSPPPTTVSSLAPTSMRASSLPGTITGASPPPDQPPGRRSASTMASSSNRTSPLSSLMAAQPPAVRSAVAPTRELCATTRVSSGLLLSSHASASSPNASRPIPRRCWPCASPPANAPIPAIAMAIEASEDADGGGAMTVPFGSRADRPREGGRAASLCTVLSR